MGVRDGLGARGRPGQCAKKLIRMAVEAAESQDTSPPSELRLYWMCEHFPGALPEQGALLDQPARVMARMLVLSNVYQFVARLRDLAGDQIHGLTTRERKMWKWLIDEGLI